jgi:protease II
MAADSPSSSWKILQPRTEGIQYYVDEGNELFYIRVNDTEPSFRVMTAPVATPDKAHWTELITAQRCAHRQRRRLQELLRGHGEGQWAGRFTSRRYEEPEGAID